MPADLPRLDLPVGVGLLGALIERGVGYRVVADRGVA